VIVIENRDGKPRRGYTKVVEHCSCKPLKPLLEKHIKFDANIVTDGWSGYKPLKV
jgi:hypothetical protein